LNGISSGAANENQALSLSVSNSNPALVTNLAFSYVSPETVGVLTFRTIPDASGSAILTVKIDDGDATNNTVMRAFTLTVLPVNDPPTISDLPDRTVNEDISNGPISFSINNAETAASNLVVTAVSLNSSLLP